MELLQVVRGVEMLAGFCYTQLTDTYQEANGLLRADRTPKFPLRQIAMATAGREPEDSLEAAEELSDDAVLDSVAHAKTQDRHG